MKKLLLEYVNMFAYTFTGLIFGLAFFLLFINFYHMQELANLVDVSTYNDNTKASIESKIETIRNNINVYNQSTYTGSLNIYGINTVQAKLQSCIDIVESDTMMHYLDLDVIGIKDSYSFTVDFRNQILNDCLVMQIKSMLNTETVTSLPNTVYRPFVREALVSYVSVSTVIYSIIVVYVMSIIIDKVMIGISESKTFRIITSNETDVKKFLLSKLSHGVTILNARGGYTGNVVKMIYCVVPTREYFIVKEGILNLDPEAVIMISDVYEVIGNK